MMLIDLPHSEILYETLRVFGLTIFDDIAPWNAQF